MKKSFIFSIRFRITFLFVAMLSLTLLIFSFVLYDYFIKTNQEDFDRALYNHAIDLVKGIGLNSFGAVTLDMETLSGGNKAFPFVPGRTFVQLMYTNGSIIGHSTTLGNRRLPE